MPKETFEIERANKEISGIIGPFEEIDLKTAALELARYYGLDFLDRLAAGKQIETKLAIYRRVKP